MKSAYLTISFDDCYKDTIDIVLPILKKKGIKCSFNIIPGLMNKKLNGNKIINWDDVRQIMNDGHEIASHGNIHAYAPMKRIEIIKKISKNFINTSSITNYLFRQRINLSNQKFEKPRYSIETEIYDSKRIIQNKLNIECPSFVYPGGKVNNRVKSEVKKAGFLSARGTTFGFNNEKTDRYDLRSHIWYRNTSLFEFKKWIKKAIIHKSWLIECFHSIGETGKEYDVSKKLFEEHLNIILKLNIQIKTQKDIIEKWSEKI